jgi:RNA polymerase sigma-32 factor
MELQERNPALATPGSLVMRSAAKPISSLDSRHPAASQSMLSAEEEGKLIHRRQQHGDSRALNLLVSAFERLVRKEAKRYDSYGVPLDDRLQCANVGLIKAIDRFDPDKGFRLATYAVWWIRAELTDFVRSNFAPVIVPKGKPILAGDSLNAPLLNKDGESDEHQDLLASDAADQEAVFVEAGEIGHLRDRLSSITQKALNDRERAIFEARCLSDKPPTLESLAGQFGVSRERIRQIEVSALQKVEAAAKKPITIRRSTKDLRCAMAQFYAAAMPRHGHLDEWVDAVKRRFPEATQEDRIIAHRLADKMREATR